MAALLPSHLRGSLITLAVEPAAGLNNLAPGDTSGWGFHVVDTGGYVVLTASIFLPDSPFGNYNDYVSLPQNFYLLTPFATLDVPFDQTNQQGLGEFFALPSDVSGEIDGTIILIYDLYSSDPTVDPTLIEGGLTVSADVAVQVVSADDSAPEPATRLLAGIVLLAFAGFRRFRR
jgi:hypothetical protein